MRRILLSLIIAISFSLVASAQCGRLSEGFEGSTAANPPTGWTSTGLEYNNNLATYPARNGGTGRAGLNDTTDILITPSIYCPGNLSFYWRSSGASNNYTMLIEVSQNQTNWVVLDSIKATGSGTPTTYQFKTIPIVTTGFNVPFGVYIRWKMRARVGGTFYLDDVCVDNGVCAVTPTQLLFSNIPSSCIPATTPISFDVCATEATGWIDSNFVGNISLNLGSGSGTLGGTLSQAAVLGCAKFTNVTYNTNAPLSINASAGALSSTTPLTSLDVKLTCPNEDTLKIVTYNVLNYPEGGVYALGGACTPGELGPSRWDTLKAIMQYMKPDILIVQELQTNAGSDSILKRSLNVNGINYYQGAAYIPNRSTANKNYNNMCYYNSNKLALVATNTLGTSIRDCGQYIFYCKDPLLAVHNDTTFIDIYSMHTKARGLGAAQATLDSIQRGNDCKLVMDSIRFRQSTERNAVLGGDLNLYTSNEAAFINLTSGLYKFNDPVNQPGDWEANPLFKSLHSQATRGTLEPSLECGARGGLDSRLDFLLTTDPIQNNGKRMEYIANSYKILGNDGNLFNLPINHPTNASGVPANILRSLHNMSDHIPVEIKVRVQYPTLQPLQASGVNLQGILVANTAQLKWTLQNTQDIKSVTLQVSFNGGTYRDVTEITDASINNFVHQLNASGTYTYRLRVKSTTDQLSFSNLAQLQHTMQGSINCYPSPAQNSITFDMNAGPQEELQTLSIYGVDGIVKATYTLSTSNQTMLVNLSTFANGTYVYRLQTSKQVHSGRFVVSK
jgi:Secretion system C-terminal sorting domain